LDGLGHIGVEHVYYNGTKLADFGDPTGLKKLGVEKIVLLDMAVVEVKYSACNLVWRSAFQRQRT